MSFEGLRAKGHGHERLLETLFVLQTGRKASSGEVSVLSSSIYRRERTRGEREMWVLT